MGFGEKSLNKRYLDALSKNPLLTKSITAFILSCLNEQIASLISGDLTSFNLKISADSTIKIRHPFSERVPLMGFYGFAINAPISHYSYKILNKIFTPPLKTKKEKLLQILTSLLTITPILSTCLVSYIALISLNPTPLSFKKILLIIKENGYKGLKKEFSRILITINIALKKSLLSVLKSSWIISPLAILIAQNYLDTEMWVVFFNFVYFVLGTYQNTMVKLKRKENKTTPKT
ncbi:hypothetical protein PACTADRAFT_48016 [Pachysolen tannophilus NRRL Y-2460]|uniref:Uncharacterized protein n=1 Tax=Pachysolen tannophilus NRRL Y-2460 TaxID=669874 RepID=A0A1E4U2V1_PACTA|nr:hypothetical protein PACTADRAFT_48016 [Pachysolen tannophilus NRRL Y-2460]